MHSNKKILAITPARGGSKGILKKNIKPIAGKPLIAWTISEVKSSQYIDRYIISTEDREIKAVSEKFLADVPFMRPKSLATDSAKTSDVLKHAIETLEKDLNEFYDYIVLLQATVPLRTIKQIDEAIDIFIKNDSKYNSLISVTPLEHPINWTRSISQSNTLCNVIEYDSQTNHQRQNFEPLFRINGAIYISKITTFLKHLTFETDNTYAYKMDSLTSVDIDTINDFKYAEFLLTKH